MTRRVLKRARRRFDRRLLTLMTAAAVIAPVVAAPSAVTAAVPGGFADRVALSGLTNPTVVQFASDGRVFVAEKSGLVKVFDGLADPTPDVFADLRTNVHNFWDRGLLGMALAPTFPADPSVYVMYTYDHILGDPAPAPKWGVAGATSDGCPTPPGATGDGCVVSGRISRLQASGNTATSEQVLVEDWCQQYPSHSVGSLAFGQDGALYATGGDGASFNFTDWGQDGTPVNPCGDPQGGVGATLSPPTAEGGGLRSQDIRTFATGDPVGLDGTVIRIDPATGAGLVGNPLFGNADPNAARIVAYGMRNPLRLAVRPGTNELWMGDVGWNEWEEIERVVDVGGSLENFGWPCYEGTGRQPGYDGANLNLCESLYSAGAAAHATPYYAYSHASTVVAGETCPSGSSSTAGLAFYPATGGNYPAEYAGGLFFTDYSRDCIWFMRRGTNGLPDPAQRATFVSAAANPVNLAIGPNGDLFYVDFDGGTIRRVTYTPPVNRAPTAVIAATPTSGVAPLTVSFDGRGSTDPENGTLAFAWDLDGDGLFDNGTASTASTTYNNPGSYSARLRVTDGAGASNIASQDIAVGAANATPTPVIDSPLAGTTWAVGDVIDFSGSASDTEDGALAAARLQWDLVLQHCPSNCHPHTIQSWSGESGGTVVAPDHEYPSHLELRLTATDSAGASATSVRRLDPRTVDLSFATSVSGLSLSVGATQQIAPFARTAIVGSTNSVTAPTPQTAGGIVYEFRSWSDGGAASHSVVAGATATTSTANYAPVSADLRITQTAAQSGRTLTWKSVVTNLGPSVATATTTRDVLASRLTFVSASSTSGTCTYTAATRTVSCAAGALASGTAATVTVVTTIDKPNGNVSNTVTASTSAPDPKAINNSVTTAVKLLR